jgi:hypothetical protein
VEVVMTTPEETWKEFARQRGIVDTLDISDLPAGWIPLVQQLCDRLIAVSWDRRLAQVREFGTLRVYLAASNETLNALVADCENASRDVCLVCGGHSRGRCASLPGTATWRCSGSSMRCSAFARKGIGNSKVQRASPFDL